MVVDTYNGLYKVNFEKGLWVLRIIKKLAGSVTQVFSSSNQILGGFKCAFLNDLDILDNKTIIFSDSSTKWDRRRFLHDFLEGKALGRYF